MDVEMYNIPELVVAGAKFFISIAFDFHFDFLVVFCSGKK